ncbi:hypothetical protein [Sulfuriflexus mobilis]|uniref:hypothetical protein n=1 Tax=Sulfuriflexus mobilis TaxID=1811807 RepID=UPI000F829A76|nr:hypothetical protein [Sulfuriflexus mobilis]
MKNNTLSLSIFVFAVMTLLTGCSGLIKQANAGGDGSSTPPSNPVVAKILVYADGTYELANTEGVAAPSCNIKPGSSGKCKGFQGNKKPNDVGIEQIVTIPLLRTKGSTCWTTYDINGTAQQLCW